MYVPNHEETINLQQKRSTQFSGVDIGAYHKDVSNYRLCDVDIVLGQTDRRRNRSIAGNSINYISIGRTEVRENYPHGEGQVLFTSVNCSSFSRTGWTVLATYCHRQSKHEIVQC